MGNVSGRLVSVSGRSLRIKELLAEGAGADPALSTPALPSQADHLLSDAGGFAYVYLAEDAERRGSTVVIKRMKIASDNSINLALAR